MPTPVRDRHQYTGEHRAVIIAYDPFQEIANVQFLDIPEQPLKKNIHVEVDVHMRLKETEIPTEPVWITIELCNDYWDQSPNHCGLNITHMEAQHTIG